MSMKYEQVVQHVLGQIEARILKPGDKIPSIRDISNSFSCSKASVIRAFDELERMNAIYSKPKSGYYVIEGDKTDKVKAHIPDTGFFSWFELPEGINVEY